MKPSQQITREEFDNLITFSESPLGKNTAILTARFSCEASIHISNTTRRLDPMADVKARQHLSEILLRRLYDFDKNELAEAIRNLQLCSPFDYGEVSNVIEKILWIASKQAPQPCKK